MKTFLSLCLCFLFLGCKAQSLKIKKIDNPELNNFIGSLLEYKTFELKEHFVKTMITSNPSGSAKNPESDEVSNNIYISNCESGELLDCNLFLIENLINIKVENIIENDTNIIIEISFGNFNERKIEKIYIKQ